jgi:hypothetical protein
MWSHYTRIIFFVHDWLAGLTRPVRPFRWHATPMATCKWSPRDRTHLLRRDRTGPIDLRCADARARMDTRAVPVQVHHSTARLWTETDTHPLKTEHGHHQLAGDDGRRLQGGSLINAERCSQFGPCSLPKFGAPIRARVGTL